jgi:hypothetical protein
MQNFEKISQNKTNDISVQNGLFQFIKETHIKPWKNENIFKKNKLISLIAKRGDLYMADTNGMHKRKIIKKNIELYYMCNTFQINHLQVSRIK